MADDTNATKSFLESMALAQLAVQFLPKMALPEDWEALTAGELQSRIGRATRDYPRDSRLPITNPMHGPVVSAFEVLAEEAVKRAKTLLSLAAGEKSVARMKESEQVKKLSQSVVKEMESGRLLAQHKQGYARKYEAQLEKLKVVSLSTAQALAILLPKSSGEMRERYLLAWLEEDAEASERFMRHL